MRAASVLRPASGALRQTWAAPRAVLGGRTHHRVDKVLRPRFGRQSPPKAQAGRKTIHAARARVSRSQHLLPGVSRPSQRSGTGANHGRVGKLCGVACRNWRQRTGAAHRQPGRGNSSTASTAAPVQPRRVGEYGQTTAVFLNQALGDIRNGIFKAKMEVAERAPLVGPGEGR